MSAASHCVPTLEATTGFYGRRSNFVHDGRTYDSRIREQERSFSPKSVLKRIPWSSLRARWGGNSILENCSDWLTMAGGIHCDASYERVGIVDSQRES
jgi:hypothetical protein